MFVSRTSPSTAVNSATRAGRASSLTFHTSTLDVRPGDMPAMRRSVAAALDRGESIDISLDGSTHTLNAEDLSLVMQPRGGYQLERQGNYAVALKLDLDEELRREGHAREIVHAVQNARKGAGLAVEDRIELTLFGDDGLLAAVRDHADYIQGETLATSLNLNGSRPEGAHTETTQIDGRELGIALKAA